LIGRAPEADISVADERLSRRHAVLHLGATLTIEDLDSTTGTFINAFRIEPRKPATLRPGDTILAGNTVLLLTGNVASEERAKPLEVGGGPIVLRAPVMRCLHKLLEQLAPSSINVLLLGETGAGKEVFARRLHELSPRARGAFYPVNCASLTEGLVESELFGTEKGAFTGADEARPGILESATGGTVFLDELGELPLSFQAKLLRVLDTGEVRRIGGSRALEIDVRVVAATSRDMDAEVVAGRFRKDLYYRLNGTVLRVPPLRERPDEIEPLARQFLRLACAEFHRAREPELTAEARDLLVKHEWPGNIRELRNVVYRAVVLSADDSVEAEHVLRVLGKDPGEAGAPPPESAVSREAIVAALKACSGNQTRAARLLGISLRHLGRKLEEYEIPRPSSRKPPAEE
jgi:DNA-binding NtrC family response regulator